MSNEENIGWMEWSRVDWMGGTPQTVMTTRAPAVLTNAVHRFYSAMAAMFTLDAK